MTIIEVEATVTERGQTTVPAAIRNVLRLGKRDAIVFRALDDGTVVVARKEPDVEVEDADPVLGRFLDFLEQDMARRPDRLVMPDADFERRLREAVAGVAVDLDAPLPDDDEDGEPDR
ncbi:type II toxin-antitoxin system PrlF family antitoxin [Caenispirillum bisanense]|uniref:Antitoxin PrlF n=1 Tax=Caenispirillum bisanense TaxID=414052 RepID=A0A286G1N9_9PROT|nr:type II toxin-antitoxin system PrlF family antitoxin [Caenispirillum bisanense]SOD89435.1 antitoxin PrlF [Caenispirillum bisanense]